MTITSTPEPQAARRNWVALLYFFVAALVGLGFVVTGITMALFGLKDAVFPGLGLPRYAYEVYPFEAYPVPVGPSATSDVTEPARRSEAEIAVEERKAKARAIDERRGNGVDRMLSGIILALVGYPVLVWHLRRGRALSAGTDKPDVVRSADPPTPSAVT